MSIIVIAACIIILAMAISIAIDNHRMIDEFYNDDKDNEL